MSTLAPSTSKRRGTDAVVRQRSVASLGAAILAGVTAVVLIGWTFDIAVFRTFIPGYVPMNPVTAICLLLCAVALYRASRSSADWIAGAAAFLVIVTASAKLSDYLFHTSFRIDQLFFRSSLARDVPSAPNQMAPNTAFCLLLAGIALIAFGESNVGGVLSRLCSLCNIAISWFAIVGYLLSSTPFYRVGSFTPMALHAALCILLLASVTLAAGPRERILSIFFDDTMGSVAVKTMVPVAFLVPAAVAFLSYVGEKKGLYSPGIGPALTASLITSITLAISLPMANFIHRVDVERRDYERKLEANVILLADLAAIDGLTGILNRRSFDEILQNQRERAREAEYPLSLIMIDLDNFKQFNDRNGHPQGDELLRHVAATLKSHIRSEDAAARYGGDEFALILPRSSAEIAESVARRIRKSIEESAETFQGVTASLGVATVGPAFEGDVLKTADECLYQAKLHGKNTLVVSQAL